MDAIIVPIRDKIVEKFSQVWEKISCVPKDALNADSGINDLFNSVSTQMDARHAVTKKIFDKAKDELKTEISALLDETVSLNKIKDIIKVSLKSIAFSLAFTISAAMRIVTEASKLLNDTVILFPVALIATSILIPITNLFNKAVNASFEKSGMIDKKLDLDEILKKEKENLDIETYTTKANKPIDDFNPLIKELNDKIKELKNQEKIDQQNELKPIDGLIKVKNISDKKTFTDLKTKLANAKESAENALKINDFSKQENIEQLKKVIKELSDLREKIKGANEQNNNK